MIFFCLIFFVSAVYKLLPINQLQRGRYQPRMDFDLDSLNELAQSIQTQGLIEPLIVRQLTEKRYEIIAGERRWRAAAIANLHEVPCLIGHYSDQQAAALTLVENIQREELNLIEEATGYRRLVDEFHFQQDEIAQLVGKSRSHIANVMRLLTLAQEVQKFIRSEQLSLGHARVLVGLSPETQLIFAQQIVVNEWSVRNAESKLRDFKKNPTPYPVKDSVDVQALERQLADQFGAPVEIAPEKNQGGWLKIKYFDNDTLAGLLERMGLRYD